MKSPWTLAWDTEAICMEKLEIETGVWLANPAISSAQLIPNTSTVSASVT